MIVLVFSKDGHIRTLINKCIEEKCVMCCSKEQLTSTIKKYKKIDFIVVDELLYKKENISSIFFEQKKVKIIFILTGKKSSYLKEGRFYFYSKPISQNCLKKIIYLKEKTNTQIINNSKIPLIGSSSIMQNLKKELLILSKENCPVMLIGDSGSGKEIAAKMIHCNSNNFENEMVSVNCALLNSDISDSLLFGHRKGSFTGAEQDTHGLLYNSDNTSLFMDEIENLSINCQSKLLRVLDSGNFRRIGDNSLIHSNFRLICASNENLETLVKERKFREDFYYRINMFQVRIPSLDEHKEDIEELVLYYFNKNNETRPFEKNFIQSLRSKTWPGNVRELFNVLEKSRIYSRENIIRLIN